MIYLYVFRQALITGFTLLLMIILAYLPASFATLESENYLEAADRDLYDTVTQSDDRNINAGLQDFTESLHFINREVTNFRSTELNNEGSVLPDQSLEVLDELQQYVQACDQVIGVTVPDFSCDTGALVPTTNLTPADATYPNGDCDRPNQLNRKCDPGSRFQMLTKDQNVYIAAHCRKHGLGTGRYGDIAVIQYNSNNGATCFYQALGDLDGNVQAPSKGVGGFWMTPTEIRDSDFPCASCHDNGPFIRSPYITQNLGEDTIPGAANNNFNKNEPYYFVGDAFANWKTYKVEIAGNLCTSCHRMGVSNLASDGNGTALNFGIRATSPASENPHKNPDSANSPFWMLRGQTTYSQTNADAAQAIRACALRWNENPLPNSDTCRITLFTGRACTGNREIYVDSAYTGFEQGTVNQPYRTLSAAYNKACDGTQIHLKAGLYPEILTMTKNLTLLSEGGTATIGSNP